MKKILSNTILSALVFSMGIPVAQAQSNPTAIAAQDIFLPVHTFSGLNVEPNSSSDVDTQDKTVSLSAIATSFSLAKDVLKNYYENIDIGTDQLDVKSIVNTELFDSKLSGYLEKKINTKQFVVEASNAQKENYVLKFNLLSSEVTKEGILLTIGTEASFNYVGMKVQSGFGEVSKMLFQNTDTGFTLSDWYMPYDYYDEYVRGEESQLSNLVDINSKLEGSDTTKRQEELNDKITEYFSVDRESPVQINSIEDSRSSDQAITPFATLTSLNKTSIATYAKNNKAKDQPASGGSSVSYYDFSQISGNWDCTNFVSHALLAGGAITYDTNGTGISSTGWYYRSLSNRASSWSGVPNLYNFLVNNTTKGPAGTGTTYSTFKYNASAGYPYQIGDVLQFYLSGSYNNWRHSTIITEYYETNTNLVLGALVTGRSGKNSYNDNQKAEEIYPGDSKRVIKLTGYYK
ncbi:amidase domain-containing protein [Paenibacillus sp. NPDC057886]|uniref:amidase domain-containing protein n=1 Tax=Paenibacillus sp. NPDC057886 TaxID=3346270 RepID=UPI00367976C4